MKAHLASGMDLAAFLGLKKAMRQVKVNTYCPSPLLPQRKEINPNNQPITVSALRDK